MHVFLVSMTYYSTLKCLYCTYVYLLISPSKSPTNLNHLVWCIFTQLIRKKKKKSQTYQNKKQNIEHKYLNHGAPITKCEVSNSFFFFFFFVLSIWQVHLGAFREYQKCIALSYKYKIFEKKKKCKSHLRCVLESQMYVWMCAQETVCVQGTWPAVMFHSVCSILCLLLFCQKQLNSKQALKVMSLTEYRVPFV